VFILLLISLGCAFANAHEIQHVDYASDVTYILDDSGVTSTRILSRDSLLTQDQPPNVLKNNYLIEIHFHFCEVHFLLENDILLVIHFHFCEFYFLLENDILLVIHFHFCEVHFLLKNDILLEIHFHFCEVHFLLEINFLSCSTENNILFKDSYLLKIHFHFCKVHFLLEIGFLPCSAKNDTRPLTSFTHAQSRRKLKRHMTRHQFHPTEQRGVATQKMTRGRTQKTQKMTQNTTLNLASNGELRSVACALWVDTRRTLQQDHQPSVDIFIFQTTQCTTTAFYPSSTSLQQTTPRPSLWWYLTADTTMAVCGVLLASTPCWTPCASATQSPAFAPARVHLYSQAATRPPSFPETADRPSLTDGDQRLFSSAATHRSGGGGVTASTTRPSSP
jgi:hypothetical protein